jgi:hypothetical protein
MPRVYRPLRATIVAAIAASLIGCAAPRATQSAAPDFKAPLDPVEASAILSPGPRVDLLVVKDPRTGEPIGEETHTANAPDGRGAWTTVAQRDTEPARTTSFRRDPDGTVRMEWSRAPKDTEPGGPVRLFVFDPPLGMYPPVLEPGSVFEDRTRLTERRPGDEQRVVLSGKAIRRVSLIGPDHADWPFEDQQGRAVVAEMRIEVGPAVATVLSTTHLPPEGPAGAELVDYSVRVLGLRFKHERTLLVPAGPGVDQASKF